MNQNHSMHRDNTLNHIIKNRRSIYPSMYTGEVVGTEVIEQLLENANWAPNHKKTEPWRFIVFGGEGKKELADYLLAYYKMKTPESDWSEIKMKKIHSKPIISSHVIAICMQRDEDERVPEWEEIAAVSCAVQNMWLTASDLGLASYWSSPSSIQNGQAFLGLKEGQRCLGLFYIGVPKPEAPRTSVRGPISSKVEWRS